jgi:succinate dehydrogenase / fumarate reductase cytochrome b subunit
MMMQNQPPDSRRPLKKARPKNLNLFTIRMPVNALVSILHRVSGVVLFLILPLVLVLLQLSLSSAQGFAVVQQLLNSVLIKLLLLGLAWAFFHHFFAGIRHLAMDIHWATSLIKARYTSKVVLVLGGLATALLAASWVL